ncbi:hypothetical protein C3744_17445 [Priestia megaterium]|uniref:Uncharacterized protein n=2 Tax=Priestia megaterium TaxID=1404 RepID=A0A3D8X0S6_PRIMG|nr:hypothetical protein C3744_17445 [Priestia megaterium]
MKAVQIQSYSKRLEAFNDGPIPRINKHHVLIKVAEASCRQVNEVIAKIVKGKAHVKIFMTIQEGETTI